MIKSLEIQFWPMEPGFGAVFAISPEGSTVMFCDLLKVVSIVVNLLGIQHDL